MSSARLVKRRIKSAKNISQITKAMEMVSASKMRRAQDQALSSRPYAERLTSMLRMVALRTEKSSHPLLAQNESGKTLVVVFSTDRGLAGGLNTNLFKEVEELVKNKHASFVVVGKKARDYALRFGKNVVAEFSGLPERISFEHSLPISKLVMDAFLSKEYGEVFLIHMKFISTLSQKPAIEQLLPLAYPAVEHPEELIIAQSNYMFEPNSKAVLEVLLPYYIETEIYQTMLDARASEHSARMVAMKNASDSAGEIVDELELVYNKTRQANITNELIEITTAALTLASS